MEFETKISWVMTSVQNFAELPRTVRVETTEKSPHGPHIPRPTAAILKYRAQWEKILHCAFIWAYLMHIHELFTLRRWKSLTTNRRRIATVFSLNFAYCEVPNI